MGLHVATSGWTDAFDHGVYSATNRFSVRRSRPARKKRTHQEFGHAISTGKKRTLSSDFLASTTAVTAATMPP